MEKKRLMKLLKRELDPFLKKEGYELYHMEFVRENKDWFLRVYIDRQSLDNKKASIAGIGTDDCEKVSRYLSERLDVLDPIEQNYYLEVSSPGLDRTLYTEDHFNRYKGKLVDINLYDSIDGKKAITGSLRGYVDNIITIEDEKGNLIQIPQKKVSKVRLTPIF